MIKIAIIGAAGRMGSRIVALANDFEIVGKITRENEDLGAPDVAIDFSSPEATRKWLPACRERKIPMLIGTTGLTREDHLAIDDAARDIAILQATNTSFGIAVLNRIVSDVAKSLGDDCQIDIVETHHRHKKDAPSGTAITLRESARRDTPIKSIREGEEIGTHTVNFMMPGERIELTHRAVDRDVFARGALKAAEWLRGRVPGRYYFSDIIESTAERNDGRSI